VQTTSQSSKQVPQLDVDEPACDFFTTEANDITYNTQQSVSARQRIDSTNVNLLLGLHREEQAITSFKDHTVKPRA